MYQLLAIALLVAGQTQVAASNVKNDPPFRITLTTKTPIVALGQKIAISIELKNISDHAINCSSILEETGLDASFRYEVKDPDGKIMKIRQEEHAEEESGNLVFCTLQPGETMTRNVDTVARVFDIKLLGKYSIQVSRSTEGRPEGPPIKSNPITIEVK